jgi:hypothetical protein
VASLQFLEVIAMKSRKFTLLAAFLTFAACASAQDAIPSGTILPVQLNSSFSLKTRPSKVITGRVMQDVLLPSGATIRAGTRLVGHVIAVTAPTNGTSARISFAFDKVVASGRTIPITTDLRAMASFMDVEETQIPEAGPDRGTPENAYTTVLVGGDVDYRGGGPVMEGPRTVGRPVSDGVLSQVSSKPGTDCRGKIEGDSGTQALWVFSSDACGLYGFPGIAIAHAGRSNPIGEIALTSNNNKLNVHSGSGMLLRVVGRSENTL